MSSSSLLLFLVLTLSPPPPLSSPSLPPSSISTPTPSHTDTLLGKLLCVCVCGACLCVRVCVCTRVQYIHVDLWAYQRLICSWTHRERAGETSSRGRCLLADSTHTSMSRTSTDATEGESMTTTALGLLLQPHTRTGKSQISLTVVRIYKGRL